MNYTISAEFFQNFFTWTSLNMYRFCFVLKYELKLYLICQIAWYMESYFSNTDKFHDQF